jgi:hypothetical protein
MKNGKSEKEIIELVLEDYSIDKDTVERDLADFSNMLNNYQIIETNED